MDMVERVARAICIERGGDPDRASAAINNTRDDLGPEPDVAIRNWKNYSGAARAAIEAMREPTEEMLKAGASDAVLYSGLPTSPLAKRYRAMISAALQQEGKGE